MYKHVYVTLAILVIFIIQVNSERLCEYKGCECQGIDNSIIVKCLFSDDEVTKIDFKNLDLENADILNLDLENADILNLDLVNPDILNLDDENSTVGNLNAENATVGYLDTEEILNITLPRRLISLDLSSNNLTENGATYSNYLEILLVNNNSYTELAPNFFFYLPKLKTVDLSDNLLTNLHPHQFKNVSTLEKLYLANNRFTTTSQINFVDLVNLKIINLDNNYVGPEIAIKSLFSTSGYGLSRNIQNISISGVELTDLPENYFTPAKILKVLIISHNNLTQFFKLPVKLEYLDVSHNPVKHLNSSNFPLYDPPSNTSCTVSHLRVLKMNHLEIEEVPQNVFASLKLNTLELSDNKYLQKISNLTFGAHVFDDKYKFSVKNLNLRGSNISTVDKAFSVLFKNVDRLDLQENPWKCDCQLSWLRNLSISANLTRELRCMYPRNLLNAKLFDVKPEDFICPTGTVALIITIVLSSIVFILMGAGLFIWFLLPQFRPVLKFGLPGV